MEANYPCVKYTITELRLPRGRQWERERATGRDRRSSVAMFGTPAGSRRRGAVKTRAAGAGFGLAGVTGLAAGGAG